MYAASEKDLAYWRTTKAVNYLANLLLTNRYRDWDAGNWGTRSTPWCSTTGWCSRSRRRRGRLFGGGVRQAFRRQPPLSGRGTARAKNQPHEATGARESHFACAVRIVRPAVVV